MVTSTVIVNTTPSCTDLTSICVKGSAAAVQGCLCCCVGVRLPTVPARALCRWMAAQGRRRLLPGQVQVGRGLRRLGSQGGVCSAARIVAEKRSGSRRAARSSNGIEFGAAWRVGGAAAMVPSRPKRRGACATRDTRSALGLTRRRPTRLPASTLYVDMRVAARSRCILRTGVVILYHGGSHVHFLKR